MCCIFTCCGWMIDLIQRLWTFTMSCIISSAVCCSLVTASMSGVALGYNYSLAEYIDLKETNVSVYLKRGIFDDEIADDMDWRRSGRMPVAGHIGENNLMTGPSDESTTLRSGRRLDDSIYESNDRNNFEGSLMRLTAKVPDPFTVHTTASTPENQNVQQYPLGSLDQLKAVQSAINMNKAAAAARRMPNANQMSQSQVKQADYSDPSNLGGRRGMKFDVPPFDRPSTPNSLRNAVPDDQINNPARWMLPKLPSKSVPNEMLYKDDYMDPSFMGPTYPSPVTPRAGPVRPSKPKISHRTRPSAATKLTKPSRSPEPNLPKSIDEEMESFKEKLLVDKFDDTGLKDDEFLKKIKTGVRKPNEDYEEEIKGIPLRKKRHVDSNTNKFNILDEKVKDTLTSKIMEILKKENHVINTNLQNNIKNDTEVQKLDSSTDRISSYKLIQIIISKLFS